MNMANEKLCLKWNDFQENALSAFGTLREDRDFADVTLACEDGQQVEAHKVIVAASSPFFQKLLERNQHPHPLIYMRMVTFEDLTALVDFIYFGKANIPQENIESFLAIAEDLQVKGLDSNQRGWNEPSMEPPIISQELDTKQETLNSSENIDVNSKSFPNQTNKNSYLQENYSETFSNVVALEEKVRSLMKKGENRINQGRCMNFARVCTVCGKEGRITQIKNHIEVKHIKGISIPCSYCPKMFR